MLTSPGSEYAYVEVIAGGATDWDYTTKVWRACTWEAKEQQLSYLGWRKERGDIDKLGELLAAPPEIVFFENCPI